MDETGSMFKISKIAKQNWGISPPLGQENSYNLGIGYASSSHSLLNFSIDFQNHFSEKHEKLQNSYITLGLISLFGSAHDFTISNDYAITLLNNSYIDSSTTYSWYNGLTSFGFKLGFGTDIILDFKNSSRYLFTIEIDYNQSLRSVSGATLEYTINDLGNNFKLRFHSFSRGSGVFIRISRRIQVYPWRPNRKVEK
jgi:hypothetical protein